MEAALSRFARDETGATGIEYALIAMLVAVGIMLALSALGASLKDIFDLVASEVTGHVP
jgi:pilus assembly protein Flp/PilA